MHDLLVHEELMHISLIQFTGVHKLSEGFEIPTIEMRKLLVNEVFVRSRKSIAGLLSSGCRAAKERTGPLLIG